MDRMWAPWRMTYILSAAGEQGPQECIFCRFPAQGPEHYAENLVLCCTPQAFVVMNRYPYNSGHIMVVPRAHGGDLMALPAEDYAATCELLRKSLHLVKTELRAHGANVGMNQGRVAGAGIDHHSHFHIVPRWNGDTNFMPVVAEVRVISEHLTATYEKLRPAFAALEQPDPPG